MAQSKLNRDAVQIFIVKIPANQQWAVMFGNPADNPGTWNECPIVADDGSQRWLFQSLDDFRDWNISARRNPMTLADCYGSYMYAVR